MLCDSCGNQNDKNAKFCEKCGQPLSKKLEKKSNSNQNHDKLKSLSKKNKIIMGVSIIICLIAIIVLGILLNNPVKKVEDHLEAYYTNYSNNNKELKEIGKILKNNKNQENTLNSIKKTTKNKLEKWVKNFNKEYSDIDSLNNAYDKIIGIINDIYKYFDGLEYILDKDLYTVYKTEILELKESKQNYLKAKEHEDNDYQVYFYYQKVIDKDCYYREAQDYINDYVKEEIATLKASVEKIIKIKKDMSDEDILKVYYEGLKYLDKNKKVNNIDLSTSNEYKKLYEEIASNVVVYTRKKTDELEKKESFDEAIKILDQSLKYLNNESSAYNELNDLKNKYVDKLPIELVDQYRVSYQGTNATSWKKTIVGKDYDSSISFSFKGENENIVYRLDKKYSRLKTTIIRGDDWIDNLSGYFLISGDNKELYRSENITPNNEFNAIIDIDITDVNNLKIEFITTSNRSGWNTYNIYLVEPYLYK